MSRFKPMSSGFHTHTMHGSLDSPANTSDLIKRSLELGRNALTITDHGYMHALPVAWKENEKLKSKGKPHVQIIHGIEPYISVDALKEVEGLKRYFHLTILFKTEKAFRWFSNRSRDADLQSVSAHGDKKPIYSLEWMKEIAGDIVVGTGCLQGVVSQLYLSGKHQLAEEYYRHMREVFGVENFFVELMPHVLDQDWVPPEKTNGRAVGDGHFKQKGFDLQQGPNQFLYMLAKKYGDKMVISEDSHLAWASQKSTQDILLGNGSSSWRFSVAYSMEDTDTWAEVLQKQVGCTDDDIYEMVENSYKVSELCKDYRFSTSDDKIYLPNMEMIFGHDSPTIETLISEIKKNNLFPEDPSLRPVYLKRLHQEIDVLTNNSVADFVPYVLLVHDVVKYFREQKGYITPRGSAAGSLILYLLGISIADPIKYGLSFARFLTKGRIAEGNFPDIDLDCAEQKQVFSFLEEKYKDCFCQVSTDQVLKLKASLRDVERAYCGSVSPRTESVAVKLPDPGQGVDDHEFVFGYEKDGAHVPGIFDSDEQFGKDLRSWAEDNERLWSSVAECLGVVKTHGVHACACLITPEPIGNIVPLTTAKNGALICQYTHPMAEYVGAVKYDFLSLDTLKSIGIAYRLIEETEGKKIEWGELPSDPEVFKEVVDKDNLAGIFQMSANALRPYVRKMPPKNIMEISNILALVRPGALEAPSPRPNAPEGETASLFYVACVNGQAEPYFVHEDLRPIVEETYSVILYQEQIMQIFTDLADYEEGDAAAAMKAVSKKKKEALEKHCGNLRKGCQKRGWDDWQIDYLIDSVMASARYSFNKSHSLSYAINSYIECWLKFHYPVQFWAAKLTVASMKSEKAASKKNSKDENRFTPLMVEAQKYVKGLDIKRCSQTDWVITEDKRLIPPLLILKGVGAKGAVAISEFAQAREWVSFDELIHLIALEKKADTQRKKDGEELVASGIKVGDIASLLIHGVFDDYIDGEVTVGRYKEIMDAVKKTLKSSAKCSDIYDLNDEVELIRYRMNKNPIFSLSTDYMIDRAKEDLEKMWFQSTGNDLLPFTRGRDEVWSSLKALDERRGYLSRYEDGDATLHVIALIKGVSTHMSKKDTLYLRVLADLGGEEHSFMIFSDRRTGKLPDKLTSVVLENRFCLLELSPNIYQGKLGGFIRGCSWLSNA